MNRYIEDAEALGCKFLACDFGASSKAQIREKIERALRRRPMPAAPAKTVDGTPAKATAAPGPQRTEKGTAAKGNHSY